MTGASRVPFNDLARGTSAERSEIDAAIGRVLDRGWYALGPENEALEAELAAEVGTAHAVLVASGATRSSSRCRHSGRTRAPSS